MIRVSRLATAVAPTATLLSLLVTQPSAAAFRKETVTLSDGQKQVSVRVELALSPDERALGLMYREHLPAGTGMLFLFESARRIELWMKNCKINLDAAFFDSNGKFVELVKMIPCREDPCPIYPSQSENVETLIELPDGWLAAQKLNEAELTIVNYASLKHKLQKLMNPKRSTRQPNAKRPRPAH